MICDHLWCVCSLYVVYNVFVYGWCVCSVCICCVFGRRTTLTIDSFDILIPQYITKQLILYVSSSNTFPVI